MSGDTWRGKNAPSISEFEELAHESFASLPSTFRDRCGGIVIHVDDFADDDLLASVDLEDPFELTGVFEGVSVLEQSIVEPSATPNRVFLFRMPILAEWIERGDVALDFLIKHVLVHEIGHHFGLSDEEMHAIEDAAE